MSEDERRRLRELEDQLTQQPRLVKLARQLSAASVYTGTRRLAILTATGGALGLILLVAGAVAHIGALVDAGIGILGGTQIVVGVLAIVVEVRGYRRERRTWLPRAPRAAQRCFGAPALLAVICPQTGAGGRWP